ncbi:hypothetical protein PWT90_09037 [Aphanocladium album]|nr:hypothetical protein PWT90_09037 [Aphanocladium album]
MHLEEAAVDIFVELIGFQRHCIKFLRDTVSLDRETEAGWQEFHVFEEKAKSSIDGVLEMVEKHVRFASHVEEMQRLQMILSLATNNPTSQVDIPFSNLPVARNARFFDRDNIIEKIDNHFANLSVTKGLRSIALYGLGGVGKTHVALKYASVKKEEFPAILWIKSETAESLEQSFSEIAVRLKLQGAGMSKHEENRILILDWLQKTTCRWLLVYDNAETFELLLKYWPVASQGCVIITSRNHSFAYEPAETGIEVLPFDRESGSGFILHMLSLDIVTSISSQDVQSSLQLSEKLSGHALAISQMTGLIHRRSWSISEFIAIYDRNTRQIHGMPGTNSLDAVWRLSFQSLSPDCTTMLGIMCYLTPDSIPQALFEPVGAQDLPTKLEFCHDELVLSDLIDELLTLALIKREKSARILSLHRLVQQQFRYFSSPADNQRFFYHTTCLLFEAFPQSDAKKGQLFLLESASYTEVQDSLAVAISAFDKLASEEKNEYLYADLCASSGLAWAHRGSFSFARPWLEQSHQIRSAADPPNGLELSWTEINMANMEASAGNYSSSLDWQIKALRNRQSAGGDDSKHMHPQAILYQNLGRCKYLVGNFAEAQVWCHIAVTLLLESQNWAMLAYTYFVRGNIGRAEGDFARAREEYTHAQRVWLDKGLILTHHFNGACLYKLGCVAFDQDDSVSAIKHLRESLVIAKLHQNVLVGDYARVLHKLSVIMRRQPGHEEEADAWREEAEALARVSLGLQEGACVADDEQTYDKLVYILWR